MSTTEYNKQYWEKNKDKLAKTRKLKRLRDKEHTVASPSSLHRLMRCPSSAVLARYLPVPPTTSYAEEGTLFHAIMEYILKSKLGEQVPTKFIKGFIEQKSNINLDKEAIDEMIECVQGAIEWFNLNFCDADKIYTEVKLPMYYSEKDFGTSDVGIIFKDKLIVVDWKYGKGVDVAVENNPQLISYAVSFLKYLSSQGIDIRNFKEVETIIYQPRIFTENKIKRYTYSMQDLVKQSKIIKEAVDKVYEILSKYKNKNSKIVTSNLSASDEACKFCPAKMICKVYVKQGTDLLGDLMTVREAVETAEQTNLVAVGKKFEEELPKLEKFFKELQEYFLSLSDDERPSGVYIASKSSRLSYINNQEKVIEVLRNNEIDGIDHSIRLITLTELKKQLKKLENKDEILKEITEKKEGSKYITFDSNNCTLLDDINL